jgi:hypothetical protein
MRVGLYLRPSPTDPVGKLDPDVGKGAPRTVSEDPAMRSFLLIVRTRRIFTTHVGTKKTGVIDVNEYRWILGCPSIQWGFATARY